MCFNKQDEACVDKAIEEAEICMFIQEKAIFYVCVNKLNLICLVNE